MMSNEVVVESILLDITHTDEGLYFRHTLVRLGDSQCAKCSSSEFRHPYVLRRPSMY